MKSVNKVILLGTLGRDPEVRYVAANTVPVVRISLATNERYKDEQGNWQDRTEWHSVTAWRRLAEIIGQYVKKGDRIYVEGKLQQKNLELGRSAHRRKEVPDRSGSRRSGADLEDDARAWAMRSAGGAFRECSRRSPSRRQLRPAQPRGNGSRDNRLLHSVLGESSRRKVSHCISIGPHGPEAKGFPAFPASKIGSSCQAGKVIPASASA